MARADISRGSNLPQPLTSLIGREQEIASITTLFRESGARLVTLTGPGGIGKTRLALSAAEQLRDVFSDNVWFISLAPIPDHQLVIPTIIHALGVGEQPDVPILKRLIGHLRERRTLLLLDNVEHVLDAAPEIAQLFMACPGLDVLATGREPLHLQGEYEFPVPPLGMPTVNGRQTSAAARESDAVRLFVVRAAEVTPNFRLTEMNGSIISEICRRLDGLPLALELAAARTKMLSPDDLLARLDQPLTVLTGGPRDVPARQQTMRNTLEWSYGLLSPREQQVFRQLAVFAGGCTLAAAEAIAARGDTFEMLSSLVDKSLVRRVDRTGQAARFGMLEPIRQFALECLMEQEDEATRVRDRHARYFLSLVDKLNRRLDGPNAPVWFERIESEHDNLRAALQWLLQSNQGELGVQMVSDLSIFWHQRGYISEGRGHAETLLNSPGASGRTIARSKALAFASWLWLNQGKEETALLMNDEACSIAEEHDDWDTLAQAVFVRGVCRFRLGQDAQAQADWEHSLMLFRKLDSPHMVVRVLVHIGLLSRSRGDLYQAATIQEEALALARTGDLKPVLALALGALGSTLEQSGNDQLAFDLYHERLLLYHELGIPRGIAESIERIACIVHRKQRREDAVCLLGAASMLRERTGTVEYRMTVDSDIDAELSALRSSMPEANFRSAWERGRDMALEDAIDLALQPAGTGRDTTLSAPPFGLTPREIEVLRLISEHRSNREIAAELFISPRTVERHIENLYRKLDIHNRADAIGFGRRHLG